MSALEHTLNRISHHIVTYNYLEDREAHLAQTLQMWQFSQHCTQNVIENYDTCECMHAQFSWENLCWLTVPLIKSSHFPELHVKQNDNSTDGRTLILSYLSASLCLSTQYIHNYRLQQVESHMQKKIPMICTAFNMWHVKVQRLQVILLRIVASSP